MRPEESERDCHTCRKRQAQCDGRLPRTSSETLVLIFKLTFSQIATPARKLVSDAAVMEYESDGPRP